MELDALELTLLSIFGVMAVIKLFLAIWKTTWRTVEASCETCDKHQAVPYYKRCRKRYLFSGYQSTFWYYFNKKEYTGQQPWKYNPGQCTPGREYKIKVNPRRLTTVATITEIVWDYLWAALCLAAVITLISN